MSEQRESPQIAETPVDDKKVRKGGSKLREENEELKRALDDCKEELGQTRDRWIRMVAEMENFKKRSGKERDEFFKYANENILRELLPILDNLQRAIDHAETHNGQTGLLEGIQMTERQLVAVMERFGISPVDAISKPFDPSRHEAMIQVDSEDHEPNTVLQEHQKGYLLHDRLLRPAKVAVSKRTQK
jgi:molecular chaperone GrpE